MTNGEFGDGNSMVSLSFNCEGIETMLSDCVNASGTCIHHSAVVCQGMNCKCL